MKQIVAFFKRYFFEILFVLVSALTIALALNGAISYTGWASTGVILLAALLQVIFGTCIKSASSEKSVLRFPVTVWGVYVSVFFLSVFLCSFVAMNFYGELATVIVFLSSSLALRRYFWLKDKKESDEVANTAYGHEFDVLSEVYGRKVRLPFNKRNVGKVIGIFPFADSGEYLELEEYFHKKHTDKDVDNSRLLNVSFCERVAKIHNRLEKHLEKLESPALEGLYLANDTYMSDCGWIVGFEKDKDTYTSDYYGSNVPEKLRYMGIFNEKCQK